MPKISALTSTTSVSHAALVPLTQNGDTYKTPVNTLMKAIVGFTPEMFGALGDGATDDSAAFALMSAAVNAADGGVVQLRHGATYIVGGQTMQNPPLYTYYTFPPNVLYPIEFANCSKGVVLRGNGATIKCKADARYGVYNTDGTEMVVAPGYIGVGASTPYYAMVYIHGCNNVYVENLELDGNLNNLQVNGYFSDNGIQLQATGLHLVDNTGPIRVTNVVSHHHGLDGLIVDGVAEDDLDPKENAIVSCSQFYCNGRQGVSIVGGKGWVFDSVQASWTGKANPNSDVAGQVSSNPGAGFDLEAEGVKCIRDTELRNCEVVGNTGAGIVADSGTDVDRTSIYTTRVIGTTNYALWLNRPGFKLKNCSVYGTCVNLWTGITPLQPNDAVVLEECLHSNQVSMSPTGALFDVNDLLWEGGAGYVTAVRCTFENHLTTGGLGNAPAIASGYGPLFIDCYFICKAGAFSPSGRFTGNTWFIEDGGTFSNVPGIPGGADTITGKVNCGPAEDPWYYRTGGVNTMFPATLDKSGNVIGARITGFDGDLTLTYGTDRMLQYHSGAITANRAMNLSGGKLGARFRIARTGGGAFTINVGGGLKLLATNQWCEVEYSSSGWLLIAYGTL